jgi:hypothetical protein
MVSIRELYAQKVAGLSFGRRHWCSAGRFEEVNNKIEPAPIEERAVLVGRF